MKHAIGLAIVIFVGIIAWQLGSNMNGHALSMAVGVLFGMLAGIPTALLVATTIRQPQQVQHHHEHDVTVRLVPPRVRTVMADHGANDAVMINGQWLLLQDDREVSTP